jgi:rubrerythrin
MAGFVLGRPREAGWSGDEAHAGLEAMADRFGAFEILTMAEQIERQGAGFYRAAAAKFDEEELRSLFFQLAQWELSHQQVIADMNRELLERRDNRLSLDEAGFLSSNPQRLASLAKSAVKGDLGRQLSAVTGRAGILELALTIERDTIAFYHALDKSVRDLTASGKIKAILEEENKHIAILTQAMKGR